MFPMSPEDSFRQVMHYQDEQREQVARERTARAASAKRPVEPSGALNAGSSGSRELWMAPRRVLHALRGMHGVALHGAR